MTIEARSTKTPWGLKIPANPETAGSNDATVDPDTLKFKRGHLQVTSGMRTDLIPPRSSTPSPPVTASGPLGGLWGQREQFRVSCLRLARRMPRPQ